MTINLVDVALSAVKAAGPDASEDARMAEFWKIFDERMELCHRALNCRHDRLMGTLSDAAPILWQYGALARLEKGEKIDDLLFHGYSTISLGYAGLWECVYALIGKKLTEFQGEALGLDIMKKLNEYTAKWKKASDIDFSIYGTPLESTTYRFAKCLQERFGIVKGVTSRSRRSSRSSRPEVPSPTWRCRTCSTTSRPSSPSCSSSTTTSCTPS